MLSRDSPSLTPPPDTTAHPTNVPDTVPFPDPRKADDPMRLDGLQSARVLLRRLMDDRQCVPVEMIDAARRRFRTRSRASPNNVPDPNGMKSRDGRAMLCFFLEHRN